MARIFHAGRIASTRGKPSCRKSTLLGYQVFRPEDACLLNLLPWKGKKLPKIFSGSVILKRLNFLPHARGWWWTSCAAARLPPSSCRRCGPPWRRLRWRPARTCGLLGSLLYSKPAFGHFTGAEVKLLDGFLLNSNQFLEANVFKY